MCIRDGVFALCDERDWGMIGLDRKRERGRVRTTEREREGKVREERVTGGSSQC